MIDSAPKIDFLIQQVSDSAMIVTPLTEHALEYSTTSISFENISEYPTDSNGYMISRRREKLAHILIEFAEKEGLQFAMYSPVDGVALLDPA